MSSHVAADPTHAAARLSALRSRRGLVVEIEQVVDVRDEPGRLAGAHAQEQVAAGDQQLVAELERLGDVGRRIVRGPALHRANIEPRGAAAYAGFVAIAQIATA